MKLHPIKSSKDLPGLPVSIEFVIEGKSLRSVVLRNGPAGDGAEIHIKADNGYSNTLAVFVRRDYSIEDRHQVTGEIAGVKVSESFANEWDAKARAGEINGVGGKVEVAPVKIKIADDGAELGTAAADEVPF